MDLKVDKNAYYQAWAQMMVTIWQEKIITMDARDTGDLLASFSHELHMQSGGDVGKITHSYLLYGRMVDMGVGNGISSQFKKTYFEENNKNIGRKPKPWYNKSYYHSIKVLTEKTAELYGEEFQSIIQSTLNL